MYFTLLLAVLLLLCRVASEGEETLGRSWFVRAREEVPMGDVRWWRGEAGRRRERGKVAWGGKRGEVGGLLVSGSELGFVGSGPRGVSSSSSSFSEIVSLMSRALLELNVG